jgi:serine/threonine protein phosphatase PrpC
MERLLLGRGITEKASAGLKTQICELHMLVRKGHGECGDSAFAYCDDERAILAVFDGVSGEPDAANASSLAATHVIEFLKSKPHDDKAIRDALIHASREILKGYTTASVVSIQKNGSFIMASVGDSPIYGLNKSGELGLEIPPGRPVGKGDAIFKFMNFRTLVTSVLGPSEVDMEIQIKEGKISSGEILIIASDGLSDNLFVKVKDGYVEDASGSDDLKDLIGALSDPRKIVKNLEDELSKRIAKGKVEKPGLVLFPKHDDLAIIVLRWL